MAQSKAEAQKQALTTITKTLTAMRPQLAAALPKHVTVDKLNRCVMIALQGNPKLLECDRNALYTATSACAASGLMPDGKEAAFVPYGKDVKFIPMVYGLLKMMRNSGDLKEISAECARENDIFEYELGDNAHIRHIPKLGGDRGKIVMTYAVGKTKDGGIYRELMDEEQIAAVKAVSQAGKKNQGPWKEWPEEMRKKSVIRRIAKRMPMSTDMIEMIMAGDDTEFADTSHVDPGATGEPTRLKAAVSGAPPIEGSAEEVATGEDLPEAHTRI